MAMAATRAQLLVVPHTRGGASSDAAGGGATTENGTDTEQRRPVETHLLDHRLGLFPRLSED